MSKVATKVSIVIPVYNERRYIREVIRGVKAGSTLGLRKEIIVIDDGSTDGTTEILKKIQGIRLLVKPQNEGKGASLRQGFTMATGEIVLVQDADLEYDPHDYPALLSPFLAQRAVAVYGSRELKNNTHSYPSFFLGGKLVTWVTSVLFGGELTDVPTGYKVIERRVLMQLPLRCKRFEFCPELTGLLLKNKIKIIEVPIHYSPRKFAEGKKIRLRDGVEAILTLLRVRAGL